jgi:hypothetical protein
MKKMTPTSAMQATPANTQGNTDFSLTITVVTAGLAGVTAG